MNLTKTAQPVLNLFAIDSIASGDVYVAIGAALAEGEHPIQRTRRAERSFRHAIGNNICA
jgi:hypothetical protein